VFRPSKLSPPHVLAPFGVLQCIPSCSPILVLIFFSKSYSYSIRSVGFFMDLSIPGGVIVPHPLCLRSIVTAVTS